ncbi:hypothetical protein BDN72DRAFT_652184 [Pluteus cervinus]|uniref:Uncharacterized protein n=1 Tax=Pluteus cervinus TaxID=181527 RepID=A0ACD2ZZZ0_9AGAR|nr:hypothetical protein BDN72DRAFT_652184 [Pluteus cervinus]
MVFNRLSLTTLGEFLSAYTRCFRCDHHFFSQVLQAAVTTAVTTAFSAVGAQGTETTSGPLRCPTPPPFLYDDYKHIKPWFRSEYKPDDGITDGTATTLPRRGRPAKDQDQDAPSNQHVYIQTPEGVTLSQNRLGAMSDAAYAIWNLFRTQGVAPEKWKEIDAVSARFYRNSMYRDFPELRLANSSWKLDLWTSKRYSGWYKEHVLKGEPRRNTRAKRGTTQAPAVPELDNPTLLHMTPAPEEAEQILQPPASSPPSSPPPFSPPPSSPAPDASSSSPLHPEPAQVEGPTTAPASLNIVAPIPARPYQNPLDNLDMDTILEPPSPETATSSSPTTASEEIPPTTAPSRSKRQRGGGDPNPRSSKASNPSAKARKLIKPTKFLTPRNFCIRAWIAARPDGPETAYEDDFNDYFKSLSRRALEPFVQQSKDAKAAAAVVLETRPNHFITSWTSPISQSSHHFQSFNCIHSSIASRICIRPIQTCNVFFLPPKPQDHTPYPIPHRQHSVSTVYVIRTRDRLGGRGGRDLELFLIIRKGGNGWGGESVL